MVNRARDWLAQAERDVGLAQQAAESGRHEWACFASQQAGEKAIKALHQHLGQEVWGQVLTRLLGELPDSMAPPDEMVEWARILDLYYIPARYPNSHAEGAPFEHFGPLQSREAIWYAGEIIGFVSTQMA